LIVWVTFVVIAVQWNNQACRIALAALLGNFLFLTFGFGRGRGTLGGRGVVVGVALDIGLDDASVPRGRRTATRATGTAANRA